MIYLIGILEEIEEGSGIQNLITVKAVYKTTYEVLLGLTKLIQ